MPGEDEQQQQQTPWYSDDQKAYVEQKGWKGPQDAVLSAMNAEKLIGADRAGRTLILPKDDKDEEGIKNYREKIGVPAKAEDYGVPDSMKDDELWPVAASVAHARGIPKGAFVGFVEDFMKQVGERQKEAADKAEAARKDGLAKLEQSWGADAGKNGELATRAVKELTKGLDEESVKLFDAAVQNDPRFRAIFAQVGKLMTEHGFSGGDGAGSGGSNTSVQKQIDELRQRRIENKITQDEYLRQMDELQKKLAA